MSKCKISCIHYEVCENNAKYTGIYPDVDIKSNHCPLYDDKNLFKKLPCEEGSLVYEIVSRTDDFDGAPYLVVNQAVFSIKDIEKIGKTMFVTKAEAIFTKEEMLKKSKRG